MKKPWAGRFTQKTSKSVEAFTESVSFDWRLWKYDIEGSVAHARMLGKQGIISRSESEIIVSGLLEIADEIANGKFKFRAELEDVHMNIESALVQKIGPAGGKLHTARSRNDQIALDMRLYLRAETKEITSLIKQLSSVLVKAAEKNLSVIMPGYTHLQRAQPVLLSHHLLAYAEMSGRDIERYNDCLKRIDVMPLGSGALSGTGLPIDRNYTAKLLGFRSVSANSIDAVSDRDFIIEFLSVSSMLMMHLSRMSEELIVWSTGEFFFIEIPDAYATGSSIMPQKKNPDVPELVRGKTGRVYGNLFALLTTMKALPLAYNRDLQEDKPPVFDTVDTIKACLTVLAEMLPLVKFNKQRMFDAASGGFSLATEVADYLVKKGLPFRDAHEATGKAVRYCLDKNIDLSNLSLEEFKKFSPLFGKDVYSCLTVEAAVKAKNITGGTSPKQVKKQIKKLKSLK